MMFSKSMGTNSIKNLTYKVYKKLFKINKLLDKDKIGKGGIRTLGSLTLRRFSKPVHSSTLPPSQ